ncbi:MAG: hypothetical protein HGJ94_18435 [Desulfosarcina sp.]|nr:hypothetical protein [Desulfosarcina sp.]
MDKKTTNIFDQLFKNYFAELDAAEDADRIAEAICTCRYCGKTGKDCQHAVCLDAVPYGC